jgi:hypothetical protein
MVANETNAVPADTTNAQTWPGAFGLFKHSRTAVKNNLGLIIGLFAVYLLVSIIVENLTGKSLSKTSEFASIIQLLNTVLNLIMGGVASIVSVDVILSSIDGKKLKFSEAFRKVTPMMTLKMIGLSVLTGLALLASFLLLVVPFFFVLPRLVLAPYFMVDQKLGMVESLKTSWEKTKGHSGKAWGIIGVTILMSLLIIVLVGIYFLIMYAAAMGLLYYYVLGKPVEAKEFMESEPAYPTT